MKKYLKKFIFYSLVAAIMFIGFCVYYYKNIESQVIKAFGNLSWDTPSKVFSTPPNIYVGQNFTPKSLVNFLVARNYRQISHTPVKPGEFQIITQTDSKNFSIYKRRLVYMDKIVEPKIYNIELSNQNIKNISDNENFQHHNIIFNPLKITEFYGPNKQERKLLKLEEFPPHLLYAVICSEDRRFLTHSGLDPRGILRAVINDITHRRLKEGGSTITQQLVKNLFLTSKKSVVRKFNEAIMALIIERNYSKDKILEAYLNEIYLGQRGSVEIRGMGGAANFYFGKDIKDITVAQAALLTAIIPAPGAFSPFRDNKRAHERQKRVLKQMLTEKTITLNEYNNAINEEIHLVTHRRSKALNVAPFFVDHLKFELTRSALFDNFKDKDFRIYSTIDLDLQRVARDSIERHLDRLSKDYSWLANGHVGKDDGDPSLPDRHLDIEAALIALNPQNGHVYASVGGRNYANSNFNRVVLGKRQPGSVLKPFVFLAAFNDRRGIQTITPKTLISNSPLTINYESQSWSPKNYDNSWSEPLNIFEILYKSINVPTVRVANSIGFKKVFETISKLKINMPDFVVPSISLGSIEVSMLDMARAYAALANGGYLITPTTVLGITDNNDSLIHEPQFGKSSVFSEESAYMITEMLRFVIDRGTGKLAYNSGLTQGFYGKTGTTSNYHDAWFAGYTRDIVVVVWVGFDYQKDIKLPGSIAALPIWVEFMKNYYKGNLPQKIDPPENITFDEILIENKKENVPFIKNTSHLNPPTIN